MAKGAIMLIESGQARFYGQENIYPDEDFEIGNIQCPECGSFDIENLSNTYGDSEMFCNDCRNRW